MLLRRISGADRVTSSLDTRCAECEWRYRTDHARSTQYVVISVLASNVGQCAWRHSYWSPEPGSGDGFGKVWRVICDSEDTSSIR
jgi:hypothetical protein